mmetsp:Transcript_7550/g.30672  ORF Transcript_7550/g.30672 Transcript_7550/m.30672 type:complete len:280 (+) Transcript_7550:2100-2939(+)
MFAPFPRMSSMVSAVRPLSRLGGSGASMLLLWKRRCLREGAKASKACGWKYSIWLLGRSRCSRLVRPSKIPSGNDLSLLPLSESHLSWESSVPLFLKRSPWSDATPFACRSRNVSDFIARSVFCGSTLSFLDMAIHSDSRKGRSAREPPTSLRWCLSGRRSRLVQPGPHSPPVRCSLPSGSSAATVKLHAPHVITGGPGACAAAPAMRPPAPATSASPSSSTHHRRAPPPIRVRVPAAPPAPPRPEDGIVPSRAAIAAAAARARAAAGTRASGRGRARD